MLASKVWAVGVGGAVAYEAYAHFEPGRKMYGVFGEGPDAEKIKRVLVIALLNTILLNPVQNTSKTA